MKRYGMTTELLPGKVEEYQRLHEAVWPDMEEVFHID
ncbi:MAG TPA: L-rhamnose mutarotase [Verrucomicrobiae bacterium]